jgi:peptide/bleomycin uptake transporter
MKNPSSGGLAVPFAAELLDCCAGRPVRLPRRRLHRKEAPLFRSFFPMPKVFFPSVVVWTAIVTAFWYLGADSLGGWVGLPPAPDDAEPIIGLGYFVTDDFLFFYLYSFVAVALFFLAWRIISPHPYQWWSIAGAALIIFSTYYSVQVSVAINNWRRPFFDSVQKALSGSNTGEGAVTAADLYGLIIIFAEIALVWMMVFVATRFFTSHWVFRWRTAMNDYYMSRWPEVRKIEGASQRVQEDTMRFAQITEDLGISIVDSIMTLFAFLPVLAALSVHVAELPLVGHIVQPLLVASIFWSIFGTILLAVAGIKLPGLQFRNQRVEAAYRKELVYGEDDAGRADPPTVVELFANVRRNYFRLYFHYAYFNVFRGLYIQADNIFAYLILIPTITVGAITFGILQQILTAFGQVSNSFQYLVNSWYTIIELLSVHKRLRAFEAQIEGEPLPEIDRRFMAGDPAEVDVG